MDTAPAPPSAPIPSDNNKWWTLTAVSIAIFMLLLDITVVNVALPDIRRDLNASFSDLQWVVDAYSLNFVASTRFLSAMKRGSFCMLRSHGMSEFMKSRMK